MRLTDATAQLPGKCFDAFSGFVAAVDPDHATDPAHYEDEDEVEQLSLNTAGVPFTVRFTIAEDEWAGTNAITVRLIEPTFDGGLGVRHPLSSIVRVACGSTAWPPCAVHATTFNVGIGTLRDQRVVGLFLTPSSNMSKHRVSVPHGSCWEVSRSNSAVWRTYSLVHRLRYQRGQGKGGISSHSR